MKKWLLWDGDKEFPFQYETAREARKDQKIFNRERCNWQKPYHLFKRADAPVTHRRKVL